MMKHFFVISECKCSSSSVDLRGTPAKSDLPELSFFCKDGYTLAKNECKVRLASGVWSGREATQVTYCSDNTSLFINSTFVKKNTESNL